MAETHQALQHTVYLFEGFQLDGMRRKLVSSGGLVKSLNSRAMDALLLVANADELVEKRRLIQAVWPSAIVEDNNLNQCILAIRKALGETAGSNRYIMTVQGRGYRFVCPVREMEQEAVADTTQVSTLRGRRAHILWLSLSGTACVALVAILVWRISTLAPQQALAAELIAEPEQSMLLLVLQPQEPSITFDGISDLEAAAALAQCMAARPELKLHVRVELLDGREEIWTGNYGAGISEPGGARTGSRKRAACHDLVNTTH